MRNKKQDHKSKVKQEIKYVWVTFKTVHQAKYILNYFLCSIFKRMLFSCFSNCCDCCFKKACVFKWKGSDDSEEQKYLMKVQEAPFPDIILWENVYITALGRFIRLIISYIITFIFVTCLFASIVGQGTAQKVTSSKLPDVDCTTKQFTSLNSNMTLYKTLMEKEFEKKSADPEYVQIGYISCYCKQKTVFEIFTKLEGTE